MHFAGLYSLVDRPRIGFQHFRGTLRRDHRRRGSARFAPEIDWLSGRPHHRDVVRFNSGNRLLFVRHLSD